MIIICLNFILFYLLFSFFFVFKQYIENSKSPISNCCMLIPNHNEPDESAHQFFLSYFHFCNLNLNLSQSILEREELLQRLQVTHQVRNDFYINAATTSNIISKKFYL